MSCGLEMEGWEGGGFTTTIQWLPLIPRVEDELVVMDIEGEDAAEVAFVLVDEEEEKQ